MEEPSSCAKWEKNMNDGTGVERTVRKLIYIKSGIANRHGRFR